MALQRIKWNQIKIKKSLKQIEELLACNPYGPQSERGFVDIKVEDEILRATFSEQYNRSIEIVDPFGGVLKQEIIDYNHIKFMLSPLKRSHYLLSVINPPKTIKSFVDFMQEITDFSIYFSTLNIDINVFIETLKRTRHVTLLKAGRVKASGITVNDNSKASIELVSKANALNDIETLTASRKYSLDKIKASAHIDDKVVSFELSKSGSISISEEYSEIASTSILNYIKESYENN